MEDPKHPATPSTSSPDSNLLTAYSDLLFTLATDLHEAANKFTLRAYDIRDEAAIARKQVYESSCGPGCMRVEGYPSPIGRRSLDARDKNAVLAEIQQVADYGGIVAEALDHLARAVGIDVGVGSGVKDSKTHEPGDAVRVEKVAENIKVEEDQEMKTDNIDLFIKREDEEMKNDNIDLFFKRKDEQKGEKVERCLTDIPQAVRAQRAQSPLHRCIIRRHGGWVSLTRCKSGKAVKPQHDVDLGLYSNKVWTMPTAHQRHWRSSMSPLEDEGGIGHNHCWPDEEAVECGETEDMASSAGNDLGFAVTSPCSTPEPHIQDIQLGWLSGDGGFLRQRILDAAHRCT